MNIDWPEGSVGYFKSAARADSDFHVTTKYPSNFGGSPGFQGVKMGGGEYHVLSEYWEWCERPSAWNGEGLPPVGAAVDAKCIAKTKARDWFPAEMLYISPYTVVLKDYSTEDLDGEFVAHPSTLIFQPRRTPEQIAAEERKAQILEMIDSFGLDTSIWGRDAVMEICGHLWESGYRKQVKP